MARLRSRGQGWPWGTSVNWHHTDYLWWHCEGSGPCPLGLGVHVGGYYFSISGGWWTGYIQCGPTVWCTGSDSYVSRPDPGILLINIWGALGAGLWASSVAIDINTAASAPDSASASAYPYPCNEFNNPTPAPINKTIATGAASSCPTTKRATVTVYDDGTYSIA